MFSQKTFLNVALFCGVIATIVILSMVTFGASLKQKDGRSVMSYVMSTGQITCAVPGQAYPIAVEAEGLAVKAMAGNVGKVYIGNSIVTAATGFELGAGESIDLGGTSFYIAPNTVYAVAVTTNDKVSWIRTN